MVYAKSKVWTKCSKFIKDRDTLCTCGVQEDFSEEVAFVLGLEIGVKLENGAEGRKDK